MLQRVAFQPILREFPDMLHFGMAIEIRKYLDRGPRETSRKSWDSLAAWPKIMGATYRHELTDGPDALSSIEIKIISDPVHGSGPDVPA